MLAYVFWHRPATGVDRGSYEAGLGAFHAALAAAPPPGFGGSCSLRVGPAPWLAGVGDAYEDWYLVASWAALGELNAQAVSGPRADPHDAAAARAGAGVAGVYRLLAGAPAPPAQPHGAWLSKPAGTAYAEFHAALAGALPAGGCAWRRQMTLGPAGEYAVRAPEPVALPWPAAPVEALAVAG